MINLPDRLLKKKCRCGEQLKFFSLVALPFIPEWVGISIYQTEVELDKLKAMPGIQSSELIFGLGFTSVCSECGNISGWHLDKEELLYLLHEDRDKEYGVSWVYNPKFIEEQYKDFPHKYVELQLTRIANIVEEHRTKKTEDDNG